MKREIYIPDPILESSVGIAEDDDGIFYAFTADGYEFAADSAEELSGYIARHWAAILSK